MPGMEDIVALMRLNEYVQSGVYDVIVLDCPPTSEALRFVSFSSTLDWYVRKRLKSDRNLLKLVRPMAKMMTDQADRYIPDDNYFGAIQRLFDKLSGVEKLLLDPKITTVRLVTNPEKMVVRETQRAFMYFCMYGMAIDEVVINRLLPEGEGYFAEWAKSQATYSQDIREYFDPVPVSSLPLLPREVVGLAQLETFAGMLYGGRDPSAVFVDVPAYGFSKSKDGSYLLKLRVPFAPKDKVDLSRKQEDLVVRIGTFKRNILLPRSIAPLSTVGASMRDGMLEVKFAKETTNVE
jgi:arsenite-transporting ATPase